MTDDLDIRRRRALYRAQHRGTKEMDVVLGSFAAARLARLDGPELAAFEWLLQLPDPDIEAAVLGRAALAETELAALIAVIRAFHGLAGESR